MEMLCFFKVTVDDAIYPKYTTAKFRLFKEKRYYAFLQATGVFFVRCPQSAREAVRDGQIEEDAGRFEKQNKMQNRTQILGAFGNQGIAKRLLELLLTLPLKPVLHQSTKERRERVI